MEEIIKDDVRICEDEWNILPKTKNWKKTLDYIKLNIKDTETSNGVVNKAKAMLEILVREGEAYEDLVLNTALLYLYAKETGTKVEEIAKTYDKYVIEGINLLLSPNTSNKYLQNIFENKDYPYLNKIKLTEYIMDLEELKKSSNIVSNVKLLKEISKVIESYNGKTQKDLMKILIDHKNSCEIK